MSNPPSKGKDGAPVKIAMAVHAKYFYAPARLSVWELTGRVIMTIALWCILIGGFMPFMWTAVAKWSGPQKLGPTENKNPREWLQTLTGAQQRANWAQQNAFEAFPLFAAAVLVNHVTGDGPTATADMYAMIWVAARLAYGVFYIADIGVLRTLAWGLGQAMAIALFVTI